MKLWDQIKKLFHREKEKTPYEAFEDYEFQRYKEYEAKQHPEKPKAIHQDVSKFMKHGHQAPWYRKSVKAKIKPEDDEDYFDEQENPAD